MREPPRKIQRQRENGGQRDH
jgi:hypothetical protein